MDEKSHLRTYLARFPVDKAQFVEAFVFCFSRDRAEAVLAFYEGRFVSLCVTQTTDTLRAAPLVHTASKASQDAHVVFPVTSFDTNMYAHSNRSLRLEVGSWSLALVWSGKTPTNNTLTGYMLFCKP